jgi:ATP-binding cassette subfamily F protein uup
LDSFGGTLLVISHDRYFLERVCDRFVGLLGDSKLRDLPGGIDEYLRLRTSSIESSGSVTPKVKTSNIAEIKEVKKEIAKYERQLEKLSAQILELEATQGDLAFDHEKLSANMEELMELNLRKNEIEETWLKAHTELEELEN